MNKDLSELIKAYQIKRDEIRRRLSEFKKILNESNERVFAELAFCLCTPQSKATTCWDIVSSLMRNGLLFKGNEEQIRPFLNVVRFGDNKTKYIVKAWKLFTENSNLRIKEKFYLLTMYSN